MSARFECTQCARCCRNLLEEKAKGLPGPPEDMAAAGLYALPRAGGLMAWAWEAERMRDAGDRRGTPLAFAPVVGLVVERHGVRRFATLVYELQTNACPLVDADDRCGAYVDRPVVCRAYPLLLTGGSVTISTLCPGAVDAKPSGLRLAYGPAARAVEMAHHLPVLVGRHLAFLESAGAFRIVRRLSPDDVARLAEDPTDFLDVLDEADARATWLDAIEDARARIEG